MKDKPFYILSIDGGGIRGVFPAHILKCIQEKLGVNLIEKFDLIAGTSTGSILATAIACDIDIAEVLTLYKEKGSKIFNRRKFLSIIPALGFFISRYHSNVLNNTLTEILSDKTLGEVKKPLMIPATDLSNGNVHVFKSNYKTHFTRDKDTLLRKAILASCAAPTYFDPIRTDEYLLADGGLWANNPSLSAVIEAKKQFNVKLENIRVLSIGTGHFEHSHAIDRRKFWGFLTGWGREKIIDLIISLQIHTTNHQVQLLLGKTQVLRLDLGLHTDIRPDEFNLVNALTSKADRKFNHESKEIHDFLSPTPTKSGDL